MHMSGEMAIERLPAAHHLGVVATHGGVGLHVLALKAQAGGQSPASPQVALNVGSHLHVRLQGEFVQAAYAGRQAYGRCAAKAIAQTQVQLP